MFSLSFSPFRKFCLHFFAAALAPFAIIRRLFSSFSKGIIASKMVNKHSVKGYEEFTKLVEKLETSGGLIHVMFSGGKDESGKSWCPYCVMAEPVINETLEESAPPDSHYIYVEVGDRPYWRDTNCPFRKDPRTHLTLLPTLLRWKSPQRLDGERCNKKYLVEMLFSDEE